MAGRIALTAALFGLICLSGCDSAPVPPPPPAADVAPVHEDPPEQADEPEPSDDSADAAEPSAPPAEPPPAEGETTPGEGVVDPPGPANDGASTNPVPTVTTVAAADVAVPEYRVLVPERTFQPEGPEQAFRVSFDDLDLEKIINMKQIVASATELIPNWLKDLQGKRIRLRGFMLPKSAFSEDNNKYFILTRDTGVCCFGPNPTIYYLAEVYMRKGQAAKYIENRPFDVEGTFEIQLSQLDDGTIYQFYHLRDAIIVAR